MENNILNMLEEVLGKICIMETTDGSRRREVVHHIGYKEIQFGDVTLTYPIALFFDNSDVDGIYIVILKSIKIDE
jgi:hypothetical protein